MYLPESSLQADDRLGSAPSSRHIEQSSKVKRRSHTLYSTHVLTRVVITDRWQVRVGTVLQTHGAVLQGQTKVTHLTLTNVLTRVVITDRWQVRVGTVLQTHGAVLQGQTKVTIYTLHMYLPESSLQTDDRLGSAPSFRHMAQSSNVRRRWCTLYSTHVLTRVIITDGRQVRIGTLFQTHGTVLQGQTKVMHLILQVFHTVLICNIIIHV